MFLSHKVGKLEIHCKRKIHLLVTLYSVFPLGTLKAVSQPKKKRLIKHDQTVLFELDLSSKQDGQNAAIVFS